jgi:hypothetical protein
MTVEALMDLRKRVDEMLHERRAELEKQLEWADLAADGAAADQQSRARCGSISIR